MVGDIEQLQDACNQLVGKKCWSVIAGSGTGSIVNFGFGDKIPLEEPSSNLNLSLEQRENEAEYELLVQCVWRLDDPVGGRVVCGAWDDNRPGGPMLCGLNHLNGQEIAGIQLRQPGLDLELTFAHGLRLTIFCDQVNEQDEENNYSLFLPETIFGVRTRSCLQLVARKPS